MARTSVTKKLLIVESPAKIKTISKFLGGDFVVMSTVGHIKDLPKRKVGVTMGTPIKLDYVVLEGKQRVIGDILKCAAKSDEIYLAPDPDREGELIAWHIGQEIKKVAKDKAKIHRITFNEITKSAVLESLEHPADIDMKKVAAQQARRVLDRWVGYEVSPILWRKLQKGLSAGRVQSVALRLIVERDAAIKAFKPEEYWSITALFADDESTLIAPLTHIGGKKIALGNQQTTEKVVKALPAQAYIVESIEDKTRTKNAPPPFMTSTLQQAAYNRLGFSVKKTMQIAQQLYEGVALGDANSPVALITYMRTDSLRVSETAQKSARLFIKNIFGADYLPSKMNVYAKGKQAQDAHEAVRPVDVALTPDQVKKYVSRDESALYTLIWQRFVACQMKPAVYAQRQVTITGGPYTFKVTGSTLVFDGFLRVYQVDEEDDQKTVKIPSSLSKGVTLKINKIDPKQHFTEPPARYTEASLVKDLEKEGIGRPSTYAAILSTIRARAYTELDEKKRFVPTSLGKAVTDMLVQNLPHIMDAKFTAHMEQDLDKIAGDQLERDELLKHFYKDFSEDLVKFQGAQYRRPVEPTDIECPQCKKNTLVIRSSKRGEFLGCAGYPECKFTSNFIRSAEGVVTLQKLETLPVLDQKCPNCGKPLVHRRGKFGVFIACSGYPECKYIHKNVAPFSCPSCGGQVAERAWRGGKFWGCTNYPKCKFAVFGQIEMTSCPKCKLPFLIKKIAKDGNVTLICSSKECGYTHAVVEHTNANNTPKHQ